MSMRYSHTLIPKSSEFIPSATQIQSFLSIIVVRGVMGGKPTFVLRTPSIRTREGRNPFTGKMEIYRMKDHTELQSADHIADAIAILKDYDIGASGMGTPKNPPIPLDFDGPYHVCVNCVVSSELLSTSDLHEESRFKREVPSYREPCDGAAKCGFFSNPHTLDIIEVPDAGCARFWVEFQLGKSLFPPFTRGNLQFLDPDIVAQAESLFRVPFAQGCDWG
jgi:hypothetical protein